MDLTADEACEMLYRAQIHLLKLEPKARDPLPQKREAREVRTAIRILSALEEIVQLTK